MTMTANHVRALVSNRGDGNWGTGNTNNQITANGSIYFPHGSAKSDAPSSSQDLTNNINFIGWGCKSNWIVQAELASGTSCTIAVYAVRPTGVEELVVSAVTLNSGATPPVESFTHGGIDAEVIQGPVSYFRFLMSSASGSPVVNCFVIGWNEGDIIT